jgi:5-(carboxyamino)imidazole ribonucleotide mutase
MLAAATTLPVIGVPVSATKLDGLDALLAIVQMPKGVPVATVAIDGARNAGILAISMLAIHDGHLATKLSAMKVDLAAHAAAQDAEHFGR